MCVCVCVCVCVWGLLVGCGAAIAQQPVRVRTHTRKGTAGDQTTRSSPPHGCALLVGRLAQCHQPGCPQQRLPRPFCRWMLWNPECDAKFPPSFREISFAFVAAGYRPNSIVSMLPQEMVLYILNFCDWVRHQRGRCDALVHVARLHAARPNTQSGECVRRLGCGVCLRRAKFHVGQSTRVSSTGTLRRRSAALDSRVTLHNPEMRHATRLQSKGCYLI